MTLFVVLCTDLVFCGSIRGFHNRYLKKKLLKQEKKVSYNHSVYVCYHITQEDVGTAVNLRKPADVPASLLFLFLFFFLCFSYVYLKLKTPCFCVSQIRVMLGLARNRKHSSLVLCVSPCLCPNNRRLQMKKTSMWSRVEGQSTQGQATYLLI